MTTARYCVYIFTAFIVANGFASAGANTIAPETIQSSCAAGNAPDSLLGIPRCMHRKQLKDYFLQPVTMPVLSMLDGAPEPQSTGSIPRLRLDMPRAKSFVFTAPAPAEIIAPEITDPEPASAMIVGAASMYNPTDPHDEDSGETETASGETYDPEGWTAAVQIGLRARFGGVRYRMRYDVTYALVEANGRRAIVRINDVGPLRPGRIIDLNLRAMRYFDPQLRAGVLQGVRVSPLAGSRWFVGPVESPGDKAALMAEATATAESVTPH